MRAYALGSVFVLIAAAAWAALPSHEDLTADLTARPINIEIQEAAHEEMRICCKDDWERADRYGFIVLASGLRSMDLEPGPFTTGWNAAAVHRPARYPAVQGYTQP